MEISSFAEFTFINIDQFYATFLDKIKRFFSSSLFKIVLSYQNNDINHFISKYNYKPLISSFLLSTNGIWLYFVLNKLLLHTDISCAMTSRTPDTYLKQTIQEKSNTKSILFKTRLLCILIDTASLYGIYVSEFLISACSLFFFFFRKSKSLSRKVPLIQVSGYSAYQ